jgi:hypothetical protein
MLDIGADSKNSFKCESDTKSGVRPSGKSSFHFGSAANNASFPVSVAKVRKERRKRIKE